MTDQTNPWRPIADAPRDGTLLELTWMDGGISQEVYTMAWDAVTGMWVMPGGGATWTESDPSGAPTHYRYPVSGGMHDD